MGKLTSAIREWGCPVISLIYPEVCEICGRTLMADEQLICTHCNLNMPRLNLFKEDFGMMHKRLYSTKSHVDRAAALFAYHRHDHYARLIRRMKYNNRPDIGVSLGKMMAREAIPYGFFSGVDALLPVPMHWLKKLMRGYNQSNEIARGISQLTGIPVLYNLRANRAHGTQTHRSARERWHNTQGIYYVRNPYELRNRHVMIVDDVITTGSTILHCCEALAEKVPGIHISVCTIGSTQLN